MPNKSAKLRKQERKRKNLEIKKYKLDFVKNQKNNIPQTEIIDKCKNLWN